MRVWLAISIWIGVLAGAAPAGADDGEGFPNLLETTRPYQVPRTGEVLHERITPILRRALGRDDAETRLEALSDIERLRIDALADAVGGVLDDERPTVATAAVEALAAIDGRGEAGRMSAMLDGAPTRTAEDRGLILAIDRALSAWGDGGAVEAWRARVADEGAPAMLRVSAAEAVGRVAADGERGRRGAAADALERAAATLGETAGDRSTEAGLRLAAARARGAIEGPETDRGRALARRLAEGGLVDRLAAVMMAREPEGASTRGLLLAAARDDEPAVQAAALARLSGREGRPMSLLSQTLDSPDPMVRRLTVEAMADHATSEAVELLRSALGDHHPKVRAGARRSLRALAETEAAGARVRSGLIADAAAIARAIVDDPASRWREAEQVATLGYELSGSLDGVDRRALAVALAEGFFESARAEVGTAAWHALRALDVDEVKGGAVDRLASLLERFRRLAASAEQGDRADADLAAWGALSRRAEAAVFAIGAWRDERAVGTLRAMVKKDSAADERVRAAAAWALGMVYEGRGNAAAASELAGRLRDNRGREPESFAVRAESAVALGRMGAEDHARTVGRYDSIEEPLRVRAACRWAVGRLTGKPQPPFELKPRVINDTFIRPID